jgi:hypothetical protein
MQAALLKLVADLATKRNWVEAALSRLWHQLGNGDFSARACVENGGMELTRDTGAWVALLLACMISTIQFSDCITSFDKNTEKKNYEGVGG